MNLRLFLSVILALSAMPTISIVSAPASGKTPSTKEALVYFGTYTGEKSKGIYVSRFDLASGKLSAPQLAGEVNSPSFLAVHPKEPWLYAVNEISNFQGKKSGAVSAFAIDAKTGQLKLLNQQPSVGDGPCHVNVDPSGKAVLIANYGGGSCAVLPIQSDGKVAPASAFIQHRGSSVNAQRQEGPHAHGIYVDASNQFVFVPDLGLDRILIYGFDAAKGALTPHIPPFASVKPGSGPRHFAFHPSGKYAYVINEMACTITAFRYDTATGALEEFQSASTLPAGQSVLPEFSTAEIAVHPSGKFLYGSNRGHNTIAVFSVNPTTGEIRLQQNASTQGRIPRGFGIDPTGQYLLAANQDSHNVVVFRIDTNTGQLNSTGHSVEIGSPVCVTFLPLH